MSVLYDTRVVAVETRGLFRLWVRFADGTEGEIDVSSYLDDPETADYYEPWRQAGFFETVRPGRWGVVWGDPDDYEDEWDAPGFTGDELYMKLRGLSLVEMHPEHYATRLVEAKPLEKYRVWMRFVDGTEGTSDVGDFAGRAVCRIWDDPGVWEGMRVSSYDTVEWGPDDPTKVVDFCPDMLYSRVSGVSREDMQSPGFARQSLETLRRLGHVNDNDGG